MADIRARIVFNQGQSIISCVVKNLSEGGALLQVHSVFGIPSAFHLALPEQTHRPCWVIRRTTKEIAVAFTDIEPMAEAIAAGAQRVHHRIGCVPLLAYGRKHALGGPVHACLRHCVGSLSFVG